MTKKIHPNSIPLDSVVDPENYLALALEGYSIPVDVSNHEAEGIFSEE